MPKTKTKAKKKYLKDVHRKWSVFEFFLLRQVGAEYDMLANSRMLSVLQCEKANSDFQRLSHNSFRSKF